MQARGRGKRLSSCAEVHRKSLGCQGRGKSIYGTTKRSLKALRAELSSLNGRNEAHKKNPRKSIAMDHCSLVRLQRRIDGFGGGKIEDVAA